MWCLERDQDIVSIQSGFRKMRSTTDPIVQLEILGRKAIAHGQHLIAVFFDLGLGLDTSVRQKK